MVQGVTVPEKALGKVLEKVPDVVAPAEKDLDIMVQGVTVPEKALGKALGKVPDVVALVEKALDIMVQDIAVPVEKDPNIKPR